MAIKGEIQGLYKDRNQTEAIFPITKVRAITDDNGVGLNVLLRDTYATQDFVTTRIAQAQLDGSGNGDVDLSAFMTESQVGNYLQENQFANQAFVHMLVNDCLPKILTDALYGDELPVTGKIGQIFFKKVGG